VMDHCCQEQAEMVCGPAALFHMLLFTRWPASVHEPFEAELAHFDGHVLDVGVAVDVVVDGALEVVAGDVVVLDVVVVEVPEVGVVVVDVGGGGVEVGGQTLDPFPWQRVGLDTSWVAEPADAGVWPITTPTRVTRSATRATIIPDLRIVTMDFFPFFTLLCRP